MLPTQGLAPTLPQYLKSNPNVVKDLMQPENQELRQFMVDEYKAAGKMLADTDCASSLLSKDQMRLLSNEARAAENELLNLSQKQ